jgi:hypothetical protein
MQTAHRGEQENGELLCIWTEKLEIIENDLADLEHKG